MLLSVLDLTSNIYQSELEPRIKIRTLIEGGIALDAQKQQFLRKRPAEEDKIYADRLNRFTYTNLIGRAIAEQKAKFRSGSVSVEADLWLSDVRSHIKELDLLGDIFELGLAQGTVYALIDKDPGIPESLAEQQQKKASVLLYSPLEVVIDAIDQPDPFVKIRQYRQIFDPVLGEVTRVEWIFINSLSIDCYECKAIVESGKITSIFDDNGNEIPVDEETDIAIAGSYLHGLNRLPIQKIDFTDYWFANQVFHLVLEHLNLQNSRYDTAMSAGYIQRTVKVQPDDDLDETFVGGYPEVKTGSEYVIHGDFAFNEAAGTSIAAVSNIMSAIAHEIRETIGLPNTGTGKTMIQQSGLSKMLDFAIQESVLSAMGSKVIEGYRGILETIALHLGHDPAKIQVSGLDSFEVDALGEKVEVAIALQQFANKLPATAQKLFYEALCNLLNRNASVSDRQKIKEEIEVIFSGSTDLEELEP